MADSILDSTKKALGLGADYDVFDPDIMMHINSVFMNLHQLGIGPDEGFQIEDNEPTWDTFLGSEHSLFLNSVRSYVYFKVRLAFDPPPTSFHIASLEKQIQELEWRLTVQRDELVEPVIIDVVSVLPPSVVDGGGAEE